MNTERRTFILALLSGAAGAALGRTASAQGRGPTPITATKLTDQIYALSGNGGNVGVVIGKDGLLMIDGGNLGRAADTARAVAEVSPRLVQILFNTHYHFDHIGSNESLGMRGVRIMAHENVKKRLSTTFENPAMGRTMEALMAPGLPTWVFTEGGRLVFDPVVLEYTHTPLAHTDGDAFVFFPEANVIHTGDLFWVGRYPVVDYTVGGSLARMAEALGQIDKMGDANTRIIPGHGGPNVGKTELRQTREMWLTINRRLEDMGRQGRTIEEVLAAAPTKDFDAALGGANPMGFLRQAYGGVLARR